MDRETEFDFSGYATKNDLQCSDGRTIGHNAFKDNDGQIVPLVWQHSHDNPGNVLGHALLENRDDGVYTFCKFNNTDAGENAKKLVKHGDITSLSIFANNLVQKGVNVVHGTIREVSLVLSGANPGALIDNHSIAHGNGNYEDVESEAIIYTGESIDSEIVQHSATKTKPETDTESQNGSKTVKDVFDTLNEEQKNVVYAMMAQVAGAEDDDIEHDNIKGGHDNMKTNIFESGGETQEDTLSHSQVQEIMTDAQRCGSLKEAVLAHAGTYGIDDIEFLFPDAKTITNSPDFISRRMEWVQGVISGTHHTPFSRIKTVHADITADEARALGYVKGDFKKEEVIKLLQRVTTPTTIYKKQKLDRDDIVDITDLDVVAWLKAEMRVMLDEELARAVLVGDGREVGGDDKINEDNIRPIYKDDDMYAHKVEIDAEATTEDVIEAIIRSRTHYKGSGNPVMYTTTEFLTDMILTKDKMGRRIFATENELAAALRVSSIVEVPVMEGLVREGGGYESELELKCIIVNLKDYVMGADKGGQVNMFDDFDIDYNQYKYLMETRCSGALKLPKSALVVEQEVVTELP